MVKYKTSHWKFYISSLLAIKYNPFPRKSIADFRGHSQTKLSLKVRVSLRHSRGLFVVRVSPRKSANNPAADFCGHSRTFAD